MTPDHLGGAIANAGDSNTLVFDVFGFLLVRYNVRSMLDIGTGYGHVPKWFSEYLVFCTGIDGDEEAIKGNVFSGQLILHDFITGPVALDREYDLGFSAEFVEHVEEKYIANFMPAFQRCKTVVITHAEPGQIGHHHVNCQPDDYWTAVFSKWGFKLDQEETKLLRLTDRWSAGYGRRTLMLFHRT